MRALLSVYDKTGITDLAADSTLSAGSSCLQAALQRRSPTWPFCRDRGRGDGVPRDARTPCRDPPPEDPRGHAYSPTATCLTICRDLEVNKIEPIDLVISNLYPFGSLTLLLEMIDIGGPAMVRAAAKNHAHVGIVVDPSDYEIRCSTSFVRTARFDDADPQGARRKAFSPHLCVRLGDRLVARRRRPSAADHPSARSRGQRLRSGTGRIPTRAPPSTVRCPGLRSDQSIRRGGTWRS